MKKIELNFLTYICYLFNMKIIFNIFIGFLLLSCNSDKIDSSDLLCSEEMQEQTRYNTNIKSIIDNSCAYSGCHDGSQNINEASNYTSYQGLLPTLENGLIWRDVFVTVEMPESGSEGLEFFTGNNVELLRCWLENGYPE